MNRLCLLVALIALPAQAGDYFLFIGDSPACTKRYASAVHSSAEVVADLDRYFTGTDPRIRIFRAAFGNAHVGFCGAQERVVIEDALVSWAVRGPAANESHLFDFFLMLGSRRVASELDLLLSGGEHRESQLRLKRAREAVLRGIRLRSG